jgi:hypothetical protein
MNHTRVRQQELRMLQNEHKVTKEAKRIQNEITAIVEQISDIHTLTNLYNAVVALIKKK